jgi:hypothetical protein
MMNHDECEHCLCRGDFEACEKAKCSKHHFWYISELKNRHAELRNIYDDTQNYAVGLANVLHEFYKKESPELEPLDRPDYVLSQIDNMISGILDRHAELVELVAWWVECDNLVNHRDSFIPSLNASGWASSVHVLSSAETALREFVKAQQHDHARL